MTYLLKKLKNSLAERRIPRSEGSLPLPLPEKVGKLFLKSIVSSLENFKVIIYNFKRDQESRICADKIKSSTSCNFM
jgi:hypothetical protein